MFGSASGEPYWAQATAVSPSKTRAAWALPSRTRRSFHGRPISPSGLPTREWNQVHQQPPNPMPLCFSARRAKASHVEASSGLIAYSLIRPSFTQASDAGSPDRASLRRGMPGRAVARRVRQNADVRQRSERSSSSGGSRSRAEMLIRALAPGLRVHTRYPRPVHDHGLVVAGPRRQGGAGENKGHVPGAAILKCRTQRDVDTHARSEPGDALMAVRRAAPDLSLAREDVPILVDGPEAARAANHPRRHGRVDHVALRSVHQETDKSSQRRSAALRGFDGGGLHVVPPQRDSRLARPRLLRVTAGWGISCSRER